MMRIIFVGLATGAAAYAVALAQGPVTTPPGEKSAEAEPVSELDRLSRTTDNPFPTVEQAANRRPVSVTVRALDKITARYRDLETPIGAPVKFGSLEILPHFCDKRPPEEFPETTAFLEIFDRDLARARAAAAAKPSLGNGLAAEAEREAAISEEFVATAAPDNQTNFPVEPPAATRAGEFPLNPAAAPEGEAKPVDPDRIFSGWMFASSPALNPLEHSVYDVWVIDCKTEVVDN